MSKLSVVFCWHMHQPFYREADSGRYTLPWVYLHAMKDYTDMAAILEQVPAARAVVNFVPSLTAQIEDYAKGIQKWLDGAGDLPDPLLAALASPDGRFDEATRTYLLETCFRLNHERNLHRYPAYTRLLGLAEHAKHHDTHPYLGPNYFTDLVTWYHLAWLGESVRSHNFVARRLIDKGSQFSLHDRRDLLALIASLMADIPQRYRKLAEAGKIELSTTPYAHPILPLLLDFRTALETVPDARLPEENYPGGEERARDHIERAIAAHEHTFGHKPRGCWPAEGGVSEAALAMLADAGFVWSASGGGVLHHSLQHRSHEYHDHDRYHPWLVGKKERNITCFFRDDRLSDLIGFEYQRWQAEDAVANFMHELAGVYHRTQGMRAPIVAIIMDGENAWEHYHENGLPFLTALYQAIADHPDYVLSTFSDYLEAHPATQRLTHLVSGSWVYGNFATWIGDAAKTKGWELLVAAKHAFDQTVAGGKLKGDRLAAAEEQLRICEGSDWTWWFGDYNPAAAVRDFDRLYRQHLQKLYQLIDMPVPQMLYQPICKGGGEAEGGGTMRRGTMET